MNSAQVTETIAADVKVGMVQQWNDDRTSTITSIAPEGRAFLRMQHRSNQARPDGKHNTFSHRVRKTSYVPVVSA
jgi:hypothetical protein